MNYTISSRHIRIALAIILAILLILNAIFAYLNYTDVLDTRELASGFYRRINFSEEANVPTGFAFFMWLLCAVLFFYISSDPKISYQKHWQFLSILFAWLALDEVAQLHELASKYVNALIPVGGFLRFGWILPGAVLVVIFCGFYYRFWKSLPAQPRTGILLGFGLLVSAAIGVEAVTGYLTFNCGSSCLSTLIVTNLEEILEVFGLMVLVHTLLDIAAKDDRIIGFNFK